MEFIRVFKEKKLCLMLVCLVCINISLFVHSQLSSRSYDEIVNERENVLQLLWQAKQYESLEEVQNWLYTISKENGEADWAVHSLQEQAAYVAGYQDTVKNVVANAKGGSVLASLGRDGANGYITQNQEKTKDAYEGLLRVQPDIGNNNPVDHYFSYHMDVWVMFVMLLLITMKIMSTERGSIKYILYASQGGRRKLAFKKFMVLMMSAVFVVVINKLVIMLASIYLYGGSVGWNRAIQSIYVFQDFVYPLSILEVIFVEIACDILAFAVIFSLFCMIYVWIGNEVLVLLASFSIGGMEYLISKYILIQSRWNIFRYVNLAEFLKTEDYARTYYNLNIARNAVNRTELVVCSMVILLAVFCIGFVLSYGRKKLGNNHNHWMLRLLEKVTLVFRRLQKKFGMLGTEYFKLIFMQKGYIMIVLLLFVYVQSFFVKSMSYTPQEMFLNDFYKTHTGAVTEDTLQYIEDEYAYIHQIKQEYAEKEVQYKQNKITESEYYNAYMKLESVDGEIGGLPVLEEKIDSLNYLKEQKGINGWLLNERAYNKLLGSEGIKGKLLQAALLLETIILLAAGNFEFEKKNEMYLLLRSCKEGREKILRKKRIAVFGVITIVVLLYLLIELYYIHKNYGISGLAAPVQSVTILQEVPLPINIATYLCCIALCKIIFYGLCGEFILSLAVRVPNVLLIAATSVIGVVPILAAYFGISIAQNVSLFPLIYFISTWLLSGSWILTMAELLICIVMMITVHVLLGRKWCVTE